MKIDLTCPVELWQYSTPAQGNPECTFMLNNLSGKVVTSVQTTLICYGEDEQLLLRQIERAQGLSASAGERFSITLLPTQWENVKAIDLVIEKVWFDDATIWRRGNAPLTEYEPNLLLPGRRLDHLRFVAGPDAVGYPQIQSRVWLCVCGRANSLQNDRCCRCERKRDTVFATCSRENVDQLIAVHEQKLRDVAKAAREDASRMTEEREKARLKDVTHQRLLRRTLAIVASLVVLGVAVLLWGLPTLRYASATALLTAGQYDQARTALVALGEYGDAPALVLQCDYRQAAALAEGGTATELAQAAALFQSLGSYEDSQIRYQRAQYQIGMLAMDAKRFEDATSAFLLAGTYEDSATQLKQAQYLQAAMLLESGGYVAARILFADLGDYQDAAAQVAQCDYQMGKAALEQNDYQTALDKFTAAGDTQDALALMQRASYLLAEQTQQAGDYEQAGALFKQAGDYLDAALKANNSLYELARERMEALDYAKAAELYQSIQPYLDSETLAWECVYQQALAAVNTGDDAQAESLLVTIPKHTQAAALLIQIRYRLAAAYVAAGKQQEAIDLYVELKDYQDSATLLKQLRYAVAEQAFATGDTSTALPLYQALGKYKDSADKLKQCQYALAAAALSQKDYQQAIEGFTALGSYEDSATQLANATLAQAQSLIAAGDTQSAVALLQTLPDNADAQQQLHELTLAQARKAQEDGDLETASTIYLSLGDYGQAKENYQAIQYELATQKMIAKDYRAAAALFGALGEYQDAQTQAQTCNYEAYDRFAVPARTAYETKNWKTVITTLEGFDDSNLPDAYRDLIGMYEEACYNYAEELYNAGKPYEALPYYQQIPAYRDVAAKKLTRRAYLILGIWESADGERSAVFRADGTCTLFGDTLYFAVDGYGLKTGTSADALTLTHKLTTLTTSMLSLRVLAPVGNNAVYPLQRVGDAPAVTIANTLPTGDETFAVSDSPEVTNTPTASPGTSATPTITPSPTATPTVSPKTTAREGLRAS